jgi:hypothetical protein
MSAAPGAEAQAAPEVPKPSLLRLFNNATVYGVGQVVTSVIGFITSPIMSYLLTRADFGLLGVTRSISGMLTSFYRLGWDGAANRLHYDVEHDREMMRRQAATQRLHARLAGPATTGQELLAPCSRKDADGCPTPSTAASSPMARSATASRRSRTLWARGRRRSGRRLRVATTLLADAYPDALHHRPG